MNYYPARYIALAIITVALMLVSGTGTTVYAQGPEIAAITSPAADETVSGIVTVTGTADFFDFKKYEIFLKTGDTLIWGATVYSPVINGNLARLDTKIFMDGAYQLVIRMVRDNSNYTDFLGPMIRIENGLGAPNAFPEIDTSFLYPPGGNYSIARVRNCSGLDIEFDYVGITGFCSYNNLWIPAKLENQPLCTTRDYQLLPCTYRGTAQGMGEETGATYELIADAGNVYEVEYAGEGRLFIRQIEGDERAETDTGAGALADPDRFENPPEATAQVVAVSAPAPEPTAAPAVEEATTTESVLPESGRGARESSTSFIITALGLIGLMVVGGFVAMYRGKQAA